MVHMFELIWQERQSNSPLVESVWSSHAPVVTSRMAIADPCISLMFVINSDGAGVVLMGPKTRPCSVSLPAGYSSLSIRLKPGVFLEGLPTQELTDRSLILPVDAKAQFLLNGVRLQFPDFNNAELLIEQLSDRGHLGYEPPNDVGAWKAGNESSRTYARKLRRITGLSPYQFHQLQRMHKALGLLKRGMTAVEVASELAFVDQSHLTHASKRFFGHTPGQLPSLPQMPMS